LWVNETSPRHLAEGLGHHRTPSDRRSRSHQHVSNGRETTASHLSDRIKKKWRGNAEAGPTSRIRRQQIQMIADDISPSIAVNSGRVGLCENRADEVRRNVTIA
jgi:hypothetical protein